jgi:hypothetical protein
MEPWKEKGGRVRGYILLCSAKQTEVMDIRAKGVLTNGYKPV